MIIGGFNVYAKVEDVLLGHDSGVPRWRCWAC